MKNSILAIVIVFCAVAMTSALTHAAPATPGVAAPGSLKIGSLVVKVLDKSGNPVDSAKVWVYFQNTGKVAVKGSTDRTGTVFFAQLKAGNYDLLAMKDRTGEAKESVKIEASQQTVVSVVLK